MWVVLIGGLALGTLVFRLAGPTAGSRLRLSRRVERLSTIAATVMLAALVVTATLSGEPDTASAPSMARITGVAIAAFLVWRRQSLPVVVVAAAGATAGLRLIGIA